MMGFAACLGLAIGLGLTGAADRPGGSPAGNGGPAAGMVQHAASNDWKGARREYEAVDWRKVGAPLPALREMAEAIRAGSGPEARALRREIHTKYWLLKGERDPELGKPEERVAVPVVEPDVVDVAVVDVPDVPTPGLRFSSVELVRLAPEVLEAMGVALPVVDGPGVAVPVLRVTHRGFLSALSLWEERYGRRLDFWDARGARIVPAPGTVLWEKRRGVIERVQAGGEYGALWAEYDEAMRKVLMRRQVMAKKRGRTR